MMSGPSSSPSLHQEPNISKKWKCVECDQVFIQSKLLETHAVDTDHKAYRCTKEKACGKVFTLRPSWIRHERSHLAPKAHACYRCAKKFHRKDNCQDHERTCGRVARRARVPSHSTSMSPTTTSSGISESGTPKDLLTTIVDGEGLSHLTETGHEGLLSFDTSDTSHQKDDGHDDGKTVPSVARSLSVPTKPSPTSSVKNFSRCKHAPTASRSAIFQDTTAHSQVEPKHDTLSTLENTDSRTASRSIFSQPQAGSDWRHYYEIFQSPFGAPSPDLGYAEEQWDFAPGRDPYAETGTSASDDLDNRRIFFDAPRVHRRPLNRSRPLNRTRLSSSRRDDTFDPLGFVTHPITSHARDASPVATQDANTNNAIYRFSADFGVRRLAQSFSSSSEDTNVPQISEPKSKRKPPSKIAIFLSKVKAFIKVPFRKHKQS